ncbi:MAG: MotA/TolQ/ExbB proton channel family protein [Phoenicibacter congonensis]|uniref:MotA/TolQ/ExbB proton channel family protein n=1 Tax=Phoenicibacter congonensis TaxID=1944646 RepID=A0AA43U8N0_9ACTN|nr:MotA/TolQ/ExbB proton channel family protein [Phoenicibacter congonensis]
MELFSTTASNVLRSIVGACQTPVIVLLLLFAVAIVIVIGTLIGEWISERRHFTVFLPVLVEDLKATETSEEAEDVIKDSGLLMKQKQILVELLSHPDLTPEMRESLASSLEYQEQNKYDRRVKVTDLMARLAPMLGLLGTLIPLGPGILALGTGDVQSLSTAILTAFDTTSLGLMIAGFALIVSTIRKRWYKQYMVIYDSIIEIVLEVERKRQPND